MFIDTHAHLYSEQYDEDCQAVIEAAQKGGICRVVMPDVDSSRREEMFTLAQKYPEYLNTMVGLHPTCVNDNPTWRDEIAQISQILATGRAPKLCAIGEVGLDLYWSRDFFNEQCEALRMQLDLAIKYNLPIAIHVRDAWSELLPIMDEYSGKLRGVVHAYSGGVEEYQRLKEIGDFKFGIGGVVTFKRAALADVVAAMDLEDIVLETDAPYLTPTPHRGKRNEPAYIPLIAEKIAQLKGVSIEHVAQVTTLNALEIFEIPR